MTRDFFIENYFTKGKPAEKFFNWVSRRCQLDNQNGEVYFEKLAVEFPEEWSQLAIDIATSKYFKKNNKEKSLKQLVHRITSNLKIQALRQNYLSPKNAEVYANELKYILFSQRAAFNSPVWFNVGNHQQPQCSACFIQSLDDSLEGIFDLLTRESRVFKYGSGTGSNFSVLRSKYEDLDSGGKSSGLLAFLEVFDRAAGAIKSGGTTRRAAKMVIVDADHPEIEDFVELKMKEEKKARVLEKAGYSLGLEGEVISSIKGQNANNSVRVTDRFMKKVLKGQAWDLRFRTNGRLFKKIKARFLWDKIVNSAYECSDPGLQFHDTINKWNTCSNSAEIIASNPCSEFMFLNDTSCNLASINLVKFLDKNNQFLIHDFLHTIKVIFFSQELFIDFSSYPSKKIEFNSEAFRPLGIGYTNLGAFLMRLGIAYDSELGRTWAGFLASVMTGYAYEQSTYMARIKGPFSKFKENKTAMLAVLNKHATSLKKVNWRDFDPELKSLTMGIWDRVIVNSRKYGVRHSQASVIAPTGTISLMMDCETTGIEPEFSLIKYKKRVSQKKEIQMISQAFVQGLKTVGYSESQILEIRALLLKNGDMTSEIPIAKEHLAIFATAVGNYFIPAEAHLKMMSQVQPFISGAISKTVNLPEGVSRSQLSDVYMQAWKLGLKSIAIYRDKSKVIQPLSTAPECPECGKQTHLISGCYVCHHCGASLSCA